MLLKTFARLQLLLLLTAVGLDVSREVGVAALQPKHPASAQQQSHLQATHQQQSQPQPSQSSYVHEKEALPAVAKHVNPEDELNTDPFQFLNELKYESQLPSLPLAWNPYSAPAAPAAAPPSLLPFMAPYAAHPFDRFASMHTPKYLPFFSYSQPIFIPFYVAPDVFYPAFSSTSNDLEESMARAANTRRPSVSPAAPSYRRNSPIYYVRLPPMPYMFLPGLGYGSSTPPAAAGFGAGMPSILPYQPMPTLSAFSPVFNLPINFLANGKPTNIYQMGGSPNDIQSTLQFVESNGYNTRVPPPPPPPPSLNSYRPASVSNYSPHSPYGFPTASHPPSQDSKVTLKRPFMFNGRPEDIYILPNNFNSLYSDSNMY